MSDQQTATTIPDDRAIQMFGCTEQELLSARNQGLSAYDSDQSIAISLLSDAQELISSGEGEQARQAINRAKYLMHRNQPAPKTFTPSVPQKFQKFNNLGVTDRECFHLIEALRVYQNVIENDTYRTEPLEIDIDDLCERINFA